VLYNLAKLPEIQQKAFEVLGDDLLKPVTMADLNRLDYLDKVIKETLRLFPSVPFFTRTMPEDVLLGGFEIPAGTSVLISPYLLGRNPNVYPDPMNFDTSRFDVGATNERKNPFAYIPFSAGSRNCIGQKFAMLEIKSLAAKVLRNFELSITKENEELPLSIDLILKPIKGPVMSVKSRARMSSAS
jgi:cytochrome P450 family 4